MCAFRLVDPCLLRLLFSLLKERLGATLFIVLSGRCTKLRGCLGSRTPALRLPRATIPSQRVASLPAVIACCFQNAEVSRDVGNCSLTIGEGGRQSPILVAMHPNYFETTWLGYQNHAAASCCQLPGQVQQLQRPARHVGDLVFCP